MPKPLIDRRHFLALAAAWAPMQAFGQGLADASGQPVLRQTGARILSLGPDITEIIVALGGQARIIARDRSSIYPAGIEALPSVGPRRQLSAEGVLAIESDLILAADDIGPPEVVELLRAQRIPFVTVPHTHSLDGILTKIAIIAATLGLEEAGAKLSAEVAADYRAAEAVAAAVPEAERKRAVFLHGLMHLSAAGANTAAGEILRAAGAVNVFGDHDGYLRASPEMMLERNPDVVVMMPDAQGGPHAADVFALAAFTGTSAAQDQALLLLDDNLMIGFGPRTAGQIRRLALRLYPQLQP